MPMRTSNTPPLVWVGCPGMRSIQLADLERQQYLTRQSHCRHSIVLTAKGIALAERWQLLVPVAGANTQMLEALGTASSPLKLF